MSKILYFISFKCDRFNKVFNIANKTDEQVEELIKKYLKPGKNFVKIIEDDK